MTLHIRAMGMLCPLGHSVAPACAAMRCELSRKEELPYHDRTGEPVVGSAMHGWFPTGTPRTTRISTLAAHAINDALRGVDAHELERHAIILALPSTLDPQEQTRVVHGLCDELATKLGVALDPGRVGVVCEDAAGGYRSLAWAADLLTSGQAEACFVCAADSLIAARELLRLERGARLLNALNSDGLVPGEAAACLLVQSTPSDALGQILGLGFGHEASTLSNDTPLRAQGLVEATRGALSQAGHELHELDFCLSDATGEGFFFKEHALLLARLMTTPRPTFPRWSCTTPLGHTGAAAGLCNLVWALAAHQRGYAPGPLALACAGSETGLRAVLVLSHPQRPRS